MNGGFAFLTERTRREIFAKTGDKDLAIERRATRVSQTTKMQCFRFLVKIGNIRSARVVTKHMSYLGPVDCRIKVHSWRRLCTFEGLGVWNVECLDLTLVG